MIGQFFQTTLIRSLRPEVQLQLSERMVLSQVRLLFPIGQLLFGGKLRPCIQTSSAVNLHIIPLMMDAEMVSEMLGVYPQLTWLFVWEDFIEFSCCESFKSYILYAVWSKSRLVLAVIPTSFIKKYILVWHFSGKYYMWPQHIVKKSKNLNLIANDIHFALKIIIIYWTLILLGKLI
jgi:hypothetical protein